MTGAVMNIDIRGENALRLQDKWATGPKAYLGLATAGFPNLFLVTGPGSLSVLSNMLPSLEQHVEWISDCIEFMNRHHHRSINPDRDAEEAWVEHVNEVAQTSCILAATLGISVQMSRASLVCLCPTWACLHMSKNAKRLSQRVMRVLRYPAPASLTASGRQWLLKELM